MSFDEQQRLARFCRTVAGPEDFRFKFPA
jgi:hypothetical protein